VRVGVVKGGVGNGAPIGVNGVIDPCLIEQRAFPCDVLWGVEGIAARACECFGGIRWSESLGVRPRECMVNCQLEGSGGGSSGVEGAFGLFATLIFLHVNCS
jgi:hypothetical protein